MWSDQKLNGKISADRGIFDERIALVVPVASSAVEHLRTVSVGQFPIAPAERA
jgi:hypothetical protein